MPYYGASDSARPKELNGLVEQVARPVVGQLLAFPSMVRTLRRSAISICYGVMFVLAMAPAVGYGMAIYACAHQVATTLATTESPILADVLADCILPTLLKLTGTSAAGWMLALLMRRGKVACAYFSVFVAPFMLTGICCVLKVALLLSGGGA